MPLPSLGSLPSELSPREDRLPLSGLPAPLQSSTSVLRRAARRRSPPGFPDSHARAQLPGSPRDYGLPFRGPKSASRSSWASLSGTASFRQLHLLRSFPPLAESVHGPVELPRRHRPMLSWALLPLRSFPSCTSDPRPAWTRRSRHEPASMDSGSRPGGPRPSRPGEASPSKRVTRGNFVGGFQSPSRLARTASRRRLLPSWSWAVGPKPERIGPKSDP
jgi:hypothetical protein